MSNGWDHRLVRYSGGEVEVCEVFYDGRGKPFAFSRAAAIYNPATDSDTTVYESIWGQLYSMMGALDKPILDEETDFNGEIPK